VGKEVREIQWGLETLELYRPRLVGGADNSPCPLLSGDNNSENYFRLLIISQVSAQERILLNASKVTSHKHFWSTAVA
jgi:hypothetical protein